MASMYMSLTSMVCSTADISVLSGPRLPYRFYCSMRNYYSFILARSSIYLACLLMASCFWKSDSLLSLVKRFNCSSFFVMGPTVPELFCSDLFSIASRFIRSSLK